jgi:hypothetical protein
MIGTCIKFPNQRNGLKVKRVPFFSGPKIGLLLNILYGLGFGTARQVIPFDFKLKI